jgi:putative hydrolase of the HAD superfamily
VFTVPQHTCSIGTASAPHGQATLAQADVDWATMTTNHWVILDGWGVIYQERDFLQRLVIPHLQERGCTRSPKDIFSVYREASLGRVTSAEFWSAVGFPDDGEDIELDFVQTRPQLAANARQILDRLSAEYRLGLLSNDVAAWAARVRARFGIDGAFREVVISSEAGVRKPDPHVYRVFLQRTRATGEHCVFVDDRAENLTPAAALGMKTIHFGPRCPPYGAATASVTTLLELPEAVAQVFRASR